MSPLALSLHFLQAQPDSRLVALARDGHDPAFEALVRRYRNELLAYCRRLQPQTGSAEDAVQQTLLQAWRALRGGAEVRDVRPWLYRIAHNVTLNHLRVTVAVPQEIPEVGGPDGVDQVVEQRLLARAALAGMAALPTVQRQVFVSTTLEGASHDQVAGELGLSSGAVRGLIYRARATLRAAAAAITPSPALNWAVRHAETRTGGAPAIAEALAGGSSGAGVAAVLAKGGAVLTLAGAVAGTGGVVLTDVTGHRHHRHAEESASPSHRHLHGGADSGGFGATLIAGVARRGPGAARASDSRNPALHGDKGGRDRSRSGEDRGGRRGLSGAGITAGRDVSSRGGSDGGSGGSGSSDAGATTASSNSGSDGSSPGSPSKSGGSDGGSSGSGGGTTSTTSGSDGGGSGPSGSDLTIAQTTSDSGSGSDGGSGGSGSPSGPGDTTTTSGPR